MIIIAIILGVVLLYFMCIGLIALVTLVSVIVKAILLARKERKAAQQGLRLVENQSDVQQPAPVKTWEERVREDTARLKAERLNKRAARRARRASRKAQKAGA